MVEVNKITGTLIVLIVAGVLFLPFVQTVATTTGTQDINNETVTAQHGDAVDLKGYDIDVSSETVYGFNDTSGEYEVASSPSDYSMDYDPGEITVNSSSTLIQDGEDIKVSYTYQATSGTVTTIADLLPLMILVLILGFAAKFVQERVEAM